MKSEPTTEEPLCRNCLKPLRVGALRHLLERDPCLCDECLSQLDFELERHDFKGIKVFFVYRYSGLIRDILLRYKERLDVALAPVFLAFIHPFLRLYLKGRILVPVPSLASRMEERGFSHLDTMLDSYSLPHVDILSKRGEVQKGKGFLERREEKTIFLEKTDESLFDRKVVLFDDVMTSGESLLQSYEAVLSLSPKSVSAIVLMDNHFGKDFARES